MPITHQDNTKLSYDEWLLARLNSLGASEVSIVCFGSKYSSNLELFYKKIGNPTRTIENLRMYLGKATEDISAKLWENYNGTDQSVVDNIRNGTPVKKCLDLKRTTFNSKYPHLSVTIDREIQDFGIYAGRGLGSLEIKNTQSYILKSYETGLPTENVVQLCTQLMVCEYDHGDLFYFVDNLRCENHQMERKDMASLEEIILSYTVPFWENVLKARPIYNQMHEAKRVFNQRMVAECEKELSLLEPPIQNTIGYNNFLSQRYKDRKAGVGVIKGKDSQLATAKKHKQITKEIERLEKEKMCMEIELKKEIGENSSIDFGKTGEVSWRENKQGNRILSNKIKL